jgi:predicted MFS family arabinose efflux permease
LEEGRTGEALARRHPGLYLASGLMNFATATGFVALAFYAKAYLQADLRQLSIITFLGNAVYVASCPILGRLSDRWGRRPFIVTSTLIFAAAYVGAFFSTQVRHLYLVSCVSGFGQALFWPLVEAELAAEADTHTLRQRLGRFNISWSVGDCLGALVAGVTLSLGRGLPFLLCAVTGLGLSLLTSFLGLSTRADGSRARQQRAAENHELPASHSTFWTLALTANLFAAGFISIVRRLFPDLAVEALHYSGLQWGFLVMVLGLTRTAVFAVMERHHGWLYRPKRFFLVQALFPVSFLLIVLAQGYWVFLLAFACLGTASGVVYFSSIYYSVHGAASQAHRAGLHESAGGLGEGLIPLAVGRSRQWATPYWADAIRAPYLAGILLSLAAISIQLVILLRGRKALGGAEELPEPPDPPAPPRPHDLEER